MTTKPNDNEPSGDNAEAKLGGNDFSRHVLLEEIRYRRVKRWKIFSWATTVLLAIVGGTAAISSRYQLYLGHRILVALAAFVLGLFSCALLYRNISMEESAKNQLRSGVKEMEEVFPPRRTLFWTYFGYIGTVLLIALAAGSAVLLVNPVADIPAKPIVVTETSWYFAVSGDSRDCGDLIMPKIAQAIADNRERAPAELYWHLGDFRAIYRIDCDIGKAKYSPFDCPAKPSQDATMSSYIGDAWDDFIKNQVIPFEETKTPVFLGIGNHELIAPLNRDKFKQKFKAWLTHDFIKAQRDADRAEHIASEDGDTYYHFVRRGVDFIYLDNADGDSFRAQEINWLSSVINADKKDDSIKTIIVGMHAALPYSKSSDHGMDKTCQGICSGLQVYDLLYRAQNRGGPVEKQKHVYVLASHSHYFEENVFDTPEQRARGQILPGWIVGTAGAEQYREEIKYGYLQVEVRSDGTINPQFKEVTREMLPLASGPGAAELTGFCFEQNKRVSRGSDAFSGDCPCGAAKPQSP